MGDNPQWRAIAQVEIDYPYYEETAPVRTLVDPMHPVYLGQVLHLLPHFRQAAYDKAIAGWSTTQETPETPVVPVVVTEVPEYVAAAVSNGP